MAARLAILFLVCSTLFLIACGPSNPQHYECSYKAKQAIKQRLAYPSTFDEHDMATTRLAMDQATVAGDAEAGWHIRAPMIFATKNAFGVQLDYLVWYDGWVNSDGECVGAVPGDFVRYTQ